MVIDDGRTGSSKVTDTAETPYSTWAPSRGVRPATIGGVRSAGDLNGRDSRLRDIAARVEGTHTQGEGRLLRAQRCHPPELERIRRVGQRQRPVNPELDGAHLYVVGDVGGDAVEATFLRGPRGLVRRHRQRGWRSSRVRGDVVDDLQASAAIGHQAVAVGDGDGKRLARRRYRQQTAGGDAPILEVVQRHVLRTVERLVAIDGREAEAGAVPAPMPSSRIPGCCRPRPAAAAAGWSGRRR